MAIYVGENKAILLKGDRNVAELYKGGTKIFGYSDTVSGEMLNINDAHPVEHKMKCRVSSKNVIPYPYYTTATTTEHNGITFTNNGDGSITASGTATGTAAFYLTKWNNTQSLLDDWFEDGEMYTLSGKVADVGIILHCVNKETSGNKYYVSGDTFTVDKSKYLYCHLRLQINSGITVEEQTVYPMIEKGSAATDYTSYISDFSGVTVTRCGTNLLNYPMLKCSSSYINIAFNSDNSTTVKNSSTTTIYYPTVSSVIFPAGTYVMRTDVTSLSTEKRVQMYLTFTDHNYQYGCHFSSIGTKTRTVTFDKPTLVGLLLAVDPESEATFTIQLNKDEVKDFEPYKGETYTPTADGTVEGISSLSPNMTLMTDTEGVVIECEYVKG